MMDDSTDATSEDLLYDILVYREWPQSQDHRSLSISDNDAVTPNRASWSSYLSIWPAAAKVAGIYDPPQEVMKLIHSSPAWKFSLSPDATLLAVLQENLLELSDLVHGGVLCSTKTNLGNFLYRKDDGCRRYKHVIHARTPHEELLPASRA